MIIADRESFFRAMSDLPRPLFAHPFHFSAESLSLESSSVQTLFWFHLLWYNPRSAGFHSKQIPIASLELCTMRDKPTENKKKHFSQDLGSVTFVPALKSEPSSTLRTLTRCTTCGGMLVKKSGRKVHLVLYEMKPNGQL